MLDTLETAFTTFNVINTGMVDEILEVYLETFDGQCSNFDTLEVSISAQPFSDAGADINICYNEPVVLNGVGDGTLSWLNNGNLDDYNIATPNVLNTQETDTFILQIEDLMNPGCFGLDSVIVNVNPEILINLDFTPEICNGTCDGEIISTISGGTPDYIETWTDSNGVTLDNMNLTGLCEDFYTVSITDMALCTNDSTIQIVELDEYFLDDVVITNPVCFGDETGIIEIQALNLDTAIVNSAVQIGNPTFNLLEAGTYNVSAINTAGCLADSIVTLTSNPELFLNSNFQDLDICAGETVDFEVVASGGIADYNYFWISMENEFNTNDPTVSFIPSADVSVQVYATDDQNQCFSDTIIMNATFPPAIMVEVNDDGVICQGEQFTLEADPSGGTGILSCSWNIPETGIIENCVTEVMPNTSTTYEVTVTDGCSIPATASVNLTVNTTPNPTFSVDITEGCYPVTVNFTNTTDPGLLGDCSWDFGDGGEPLNVCTDVSYTYNSPGNYQPVLTVNSSNNCTGSSAQTTSVLAYDFPTTNFDWTPDPVNILEPNVQFINLTTGATSFEWQADSTFSSTAANPTFDFEPNSLDSYEICLRSENQFGCADTLCQFLMVEGRVLVNVPNTFTPDGDDLNEVFIPYAVGIADENYLFQIWSREGNLVFQTNQRGEPWDGSVKNGDYYAGNNVYTWVLEVQDIMTADIIRYTGHVTILR